MNKQCIYSNIKTRLLSGCTTRKIHDEFTIAMTKVMFHMKLLLTEIIDFQVSESRLKMIFKVVVQES
jgi:hypothetical protein